MKLSDNVKEARPIFTSYKLNRTLLVVFFVICIIFISLIGISISARRNTDQVFVTSSLGKNIIIDAGHGGFDSGAKAVDGHEEQLINLSVSRKLKEMLTLLGYNVIMTRETENSIHSPDAKTLREMKKSDMHKRLDISKEIDNPIFVSIHQNTSPSKSAWGTVVYYSKNNNESKVLADSIQSSVVTDIQSTNKRTIVGGGKNLYLLYRAVCPAVLVECSFISNVSDYKKIMDDEYQNKLCFSIAKGIVNFFNIKDTIPPNLSGQSDVTSGDKDKSDIENFDDTKIIEENEGESKNGES